MKKAVATSSTPNSDYATTENHILFLAGELSVKETIHISQMLLSNAAARLAGSGMSRQTIRSR